MARLGAGWCLCARRRALRVFRANRRDSSGTNSADNKEPWDQHGGGGAHLRPPSQPMIWVGAGRSSLIYRHLLPRMHLPLCSQLAGACAPGREEFNLGTHSRSLAFIPADRGKLDVPKNPFIHVLSPRAAVSSGGAGFCWVPSSYVARHSSPPTSL